MENTLEAGMIGPWQIGLIVLALLLLFGGKKLPELMKGMGKGIKGFKDEMGGEGEDEKKSKGKLEE
ncbi:twin-arginine translocase TatA/TatE family subunit [Putridiphycobacter roseus]|uniref:Sec-independent protein translocase protein TatA n=1 Tax=Putridiphycobacter roseus TaxID=2219161 RepID=A0A2W1NBC1_9FLAO|nr:twin-arginine translocase TatA/TatE family subunit [Putridiphycobacter roseus]PZE16595.1 twin-arginine translocase TatA/TatE family subunit [Putridiphycobacter roseus]